MNAVHSSPYAGSWYPGSRAALERLLADRFDESQERTGPYLMRGGIGFVVPHAGPAYSGTVAAAVYRALRHDPPEQIVLLAFPHHGWLQGVVTPDLESIATPLGEVPIDRSFAGQFRMAPEPEVCDHSFEIQLPFVQMRVPGARVTPLYVGDMNAEERSAAAEILAAAWRPGVVFVASSDFTHYGERFGHVPFPAGPNLDEQLRELDFEYVEAAGSLDSALFLEILREHEATVCGAAPIALLLDTLRRVAPSSYCQVLDYQTSAEITGDQECSVSYSALGFYRRAAFDLDAADGEALLDSAGETLSRLRLDGCREGVCARNGSEALLSRRGMFVSLHRGEELLGCIGNLQGHRSLAEDVAHLTVCAALDDPRFSRPALLPGPVSIEISVLTPFRRIRAASGFTVGTDGAYLKLGSKAGLLLPQVACRRGWTAEQFLDAVGWKSDLPDGAWRDRRARLLKFEAQVFARAFEQ